MKANRLTASAALLLGVLVTRSRAADVPVTYTVDGTALKAAISGTSLTFTLYGDSACTTLVHTQVVNVENVTVISKLKRVKPGGAAKPPKTDDLRTTLTSVTPSAPLYLKVTGTGITPVGGACQVQAAGGVGTTGPATGLVVKDSNGATLGIYTAGPPQPGAIRNVGGTFVAVPTNLPSFAPGFLILYFTSTDCSGTALNYVDDQSLVKIGVVIGTTLYFTPSTGASTTFNSILEKIGNLTDQSACDAYFGPGTTTFVAPEGCCATAGPASPVLGPVPTDDLSAFVPPFHLE